MADDADDHARGVAAVSPGPIAFTYRGMTVSARTGESLAAALARNGHLALSASRDGSPRGVLCGMGVCQECRVIIDGRPDQRACLTKARDGMVVSSQSTPLDLADVTSDTTCLPPLPDGPIVEEATDILIVGAGPAGLAAATVARQAGANVLVVDERSQPGGQYFKQPAQADRQPGDDQAQAGHDRIAAARAAGVEFRQETAVWGAFREGDALVIGTVTRDIARYIRPRILIIATGAYEQPAVFPGWTLPGVMTTGAIQTFLRSDGSVPKGRILVAGNGPLNLQVAAELAQAGAEVIGVVEAAPGPLARPLRAARLASIGPRLALKGMRHLRTLKQHRVPVSWDTRVTAVMGSERAERVILRTASGDERTVAADIVAINEGFSPANELSRLLGVPHRVRRDGWARLEAIRGEDGSTAVQDVFVIGEAGGFGGAPIAEAHGRRAGRKAAQRLGLQVAFVRQDGDIEHHRRFQRALWHVFAAKDPGLSRADPETLVCRCECVALKDIRTALALPGVTDLAGLKRLTRAGMGRCQGRYCMPRLAGLFGDTVDATDFPAPQMPLKPVPVAVLAVEKPEWGGHKRAMLPPAPVARDLTHLPVTSADIVVIGAGIAGLSTALFLARGGADVVVLDRGAVNGRASGGNAGSLHGQLLSFDHGAKAENGGSPAARTLPLQRDSIALWQSLERDLSADFEISLTGGLMVAETERDLAFLAAKTAAERAQGIECEVIGATDLRALEPALADGFLGAAYCPGEGKINPLKATQAIYEAALAAGARVLTATDVTGIETTSEGFVVATPRGALRTRRLVNAAGGFAAEIGRMLGRNVPVFGAPLQMIVTEPTVPLIKRLVAHADRHLTLKQAANGAFLIGGGWTAGLDPIHNHPRPLRSSLEGNLWIAQHVIPALRSLDVVRTWAAMNINIDGAPILGPDPDVTGLFHAVTSNGYTLGPIVGRITADLILTGVTDRDVAPFSIARFAETPS
jgi:glycine/D-amino acid oxidase-like deaminating enzyme